MATQAARRADIKRYGQMVATARQFAPNNIQTMRAVKAHRELMDSLCNTCTYEIEADEIVTVAGAAYHNGCEPR